jgi:hypothetical protein
VIGFICNWLIKPTPAKYYMTAEQLEATSLHTQPTNTAAARTACGFEAGGAWVVPAAWLAVWIPIGWGVWMTLKNAVKFFR